MVVTIISKVLGLKSGTVLIAALPAVAEPKPLPRAVVSEVT